MRNREREQSWIDKIKKNLVGRKIADIRILSSEEAEEIGFFQRPAVIVLDDGHSILAQSDDEGNDAGAIATTYPDLPVIPVFR